MERIRDAVRFNRVRQVRPLRSANGMKGPSGPRPCACCQEQRSAGSSLGAKHRLEKLEGVAFEKLIRNLHAEMSRKGKGDFELSEIRLGYWNRPRDAANAIEIDLVALDEPSRRIRFGSCKRAASAHDNAAIEKFEGHVAAFLHTRDHRYLQEWHSEKVLFSPEFSRAQRAALTQRGYLCRDLLDYGRFV